MMYDLRKAYQSVRTGPLERNVRRILFRFDDKDAWEVYAYNRVTFGDVIAALILEVAKTIIALAALHIDEQAARQLIESSFVDDCSAVARRKM